MALTVVLAGGGTGGHVFPALAIADAIRRREPGARVHFVGSARGIETRLVPQAGYPLDLVPAQPVLGRGPLAKLAALAAVARGIPAARAVLRRTSAQLVIGVGGYASVPSVVAAYTLGLPIGLLEPNAQPGRANRLLGAVARAVFVQFESAERYFGARAVRVGFPVRPIPRRPREPEAGRPLRLLVVGGSQGARSVNEALVAGLEGLREGFRIEHQTGPVHYESVRAAYAQAGFPAEVAPFFEDLPDRLARADLVVARAGASTVAELCMAGAAAILVPYPHAADDHQMANARDLERAGGCAVIPDAELAGALLARIHELARDPAARRRMGEAASRRAAPDAAARIWEVCAGWLAKADGAPVQRAPSEEGAR